MSWSLVNINNIDLEIGTWSGDPAVYSTTVINASPGTICTLIVYDGISEYMPPSGYRLVEVPDTAKVGDTGY